MTPHSFFFCILFLCGSFFSNATHLRSGEITVRQETINNLTVKITITVFTNTLSTSVLFGGAGEWLYFGDGTRINIQETLNTPRPDLGDGIAVASFVVLHTYAAIGKYVISYSEPNRNEGIINIDNSVATRFYLETMITLAPGLLYHSPFSLLPPVHNAAQGREFTLSLAYTDSLGNRLIYEKAVPKSGRDTVVLNYRFPENYSVDYYTGLVKWDTKFQHAYLTGQYVFAVKISQVDPAGSVVGYVVRDFQVILDETEAGATLTDNKDLGENNRIYFSPGQSFKLKTVAQPAVGFSVKLVAYSELTKLPEAFKFSTYDSTSATGAVLKVGKLELNNISMVRRNTPFPITVRAIINDHGTLFTKDLSYLFFTNDVPITVAVVQEEILLGVDVEASSAISAYPNPFSTTLLIKSNYSSDASFYLKDIQGRKVFQSTLSDHAPELSDLAPGIYLLVIEDGKRVSITKVVKH